MPIVNGEMRTIPEKYTGTRFKADCWHHLANHYRKKGEWLTYAQYQKYGDSDCREGVFRDVLKSMQLDVAMGSKDAPEGPKNEEPQDAQQTEETPAHGVTVMQNAFEKATGKSTQTSVTPASAIEMRTEAEDVIRKDPTISYSDFKRLFPHPSLDYSYWHKMKNIFMESFLMKKPEATKQRGLPVSNDGRKIREYLESLSPATFAEMTYKVYVSKTGHKTAKFGQFNNERMRIKKLTSQGSPVKASTKKSPLPLNPVSGKRFDTIAEISLADYPKIEPKALVAIATEMTKKLHPRGDEAKIVMLAEPPSIEIRIPA